MANGDQMYISIREAQEKIARYGSCGKEVSDRDVNFATAGYIVDELRRCPKAIADAVVEAIRTMPNPPAPPEKDNSVSIKKWASIGATIGAGIAVAVVEVIHTL